MDEFWKNYHNREDSCRLATQKQALQGLVK